MTPYSRQDITQADIDAVVEILRSDFLTQGPTVSRFEQAVAVKVNAKHAVATNSATSALHIACLALGLGKGDWLWTVPITFMASANCGRYCGAGVDFVDIDPITWNMSVPALREKLEVAKRLGRLPKVVVPVHLAGQPTEQEAIWALAQEYGFRVLEDASHAIGASRNGDMVGSCRWSHITTFSFHPVKIITSGEGGIAVTDDDDLADRLRLIRNHAEVVVGAKGVTNLSNMIGHNFRLGEIECAMGIEQLKKLKTQVESRQRIARKLNKGLAGLKGLNIPAVMPDCTHAYYVYPMTLDIAVLGISRQRLHQALTAEGVPALGAGYQNLHLLPMYQKKMAYGSKGFPWTSDICKRNVSYAKGICPVAEDLHESSFLGFGICSHEFKDEEVDLIIAAFHKVWRNLEALR